MMMEKKKMKGKRGTDNAYKGKEKQKETTIPTPLTSHEAGGKERRKKAASRNREES